MRKLKLNKMKGSRKTNPLCESPVQGYSENKLTPIALSGVIAPWTESPQLAGAFNYKLVSSSGLEYFIVANDEWREVLSKFCWADVKIFGLLNLANRTLIPQKVFPKGPTGENVIDVGSSKKMDFVKAVAKSINEFVVIPAAVLAIMAA